MLRKCLLTLLAASLIAVAASFAIAQTSSQSTNDSSPNQQPMQAEGRHHGPPDPVQVTQELTRKLNLTSDQQTKVQSLLQSEHSQMESLHQDTSSSPQDRRSKMMDIHQSTATQIRALLDSNQQKKWDEMQAKREQRMQNHNQGPGGNPPPPQQ